MSSRFRAAGWVLVALFAAAALVSIHPPLTTRPLIVQIIALRSYMAVGWMLLGVITFLLAALLWMRRRRSGKARRGAELHFAVLAVVLIVVSTLHTGILVGRGVFGRTPGEAGEGDLTVVSLNTKKEHVRRGDVADVVAAARADIVVLPETTAVYGESLADLLEDVDLSYTVYSAVGEQRVRDGKVVRRDQGDFTTVLVADSLGDYQQVAGPDGAGRGLVMLEPVDGSGPVIAGAHTYPPVSRFMDRWFSSLTAVASLCEDPPPGLILAGDFNATRDHAPLRDLRDCASAGEQAGIGGLATWPTVSGTSLLGATIDHVLVDAAAWRGESGEVFTLPGSDHRGLIVRLTAQRGDSTVSGAAGAGASGAGDSAVVLGAGVGAAGGSEPAAVSGAAGAGASGAGDSAVVHGAGDGAASGGSGAWVDGGRRVDAADAAVVRRSGTDEMRE